jgi:Flp pilus assembly protein TadD
MSGIRLALILGCSLVALAACASEPREPVEAVPAQTVSPEMLLDEAEADIEARRFQLAQQRLARLDKAAAAEQPRAQYAIAEVLLGLEHPKDALPKFEALQSHEAYAARAWQGMGLCLIALENATVAQAQLEKAVAADPKLWRAWTALGRARDQQGRWRDAEEAYNNALKANPDAALIVNNIGMSLLLQHRYQEAGDTFQKALASDPGLAIARANLRIALAWQGRYDEALVGTAAAERAHALNNVGYVAMLRGDYQAAQKYLAQALTGSALHQ